MREQVSQWLGWLTKLLPKQDNRGDGAVQIGKAGGDVTINVINHHALPRSQQASGSVATPHEVLLVLDTLNESDRLAVLKFTQREFGTKLMKALAPPDLYRTLRYARKVREDARVRGRGRG